MNRFHRVACLAVFGALCASPALAQTNEQTGTSNGETTSVAVQSTFTNIVGNITPGSSFAVGGSNWLPNSTVTVTVAEKQSLQVDETGAAAGDMDNRLGGFIRGSFATFDQDQTQIAADGDTYTVGAGADWRFSENFLGGLSVSGFTTDVTLTFNNGSSDTEGVVVAPYFLAALGNGFVLDGAVGYGLSQTDAERNNGAITGSYDTETWFASTNLTYSMRKGDWGISPRVGVLWLESTNDSYTESGAGGVTVPETDTSLGRLTAGGSVAYLANPKFSPFLSVMGEYDFETEDYSSFAAGNRPSVEDFGATVGLGASMQLSERTSAILEGTTALGRDDYSSYTLNGTLRMNF